MLFGFGEIALHQVGFAEVFVRASVPRIEHQRLLIVSHCRIELPQAAIGVAEIVLTIGIASVAQSGVSAIAAMVEQIGHVSAAMTASDTARSARADVAARSCRAGAVKKYDAGTAANTPATAA